MLVIQFNSIRTAIGFNVPSVAILINEIIFESLKSIEIKLAIANLASML